MTKLTKKFIQEIKTKLEQKFGLIRKVTIMGIGLHGGGLLAILFFHQLGYKIIATDLRKAKELKESLKKIKKLKNIQLILGRHRPQDFIKTDLIIKNPAVPNDSPYLKIARQNQVPIETDVGLFFELCPAPIIGITGTKGKSTTAALIAHFLKIKYPPVVLAGNIRTSVLEILPKINKKTKVVLELSSWQLEGLKTHRRSPQIAVITNIMPDHLNRYGNFSKYLAAKKLIFKFQKANDYLIINKKFKRIGQSVKSKIILFNFQQVVNWPKFRLIGKHNRENLAAAVQVAKLFKIPILKLKKSLKSFKGLEGRMEIVAHKKGVTYINDTTATTPDATIAALKSLDTQPPSQNKQIILICGGTDKKLDFKKLSQLLSQKTKTGQIKQLIFLPGTATKKIKQQTTEIKNKIIEVKSMKEAVKKAKKVAQKNDIVLLSPACASFGLFRHEFERGQKFCQAI